MLTGAANCGKTFLLKPLNSIYHTFKNPATATFAWVGVENAECIFLNDFHWNEKIIQWHDLLLLLEGKPVHFPAPKTHFAEDVLLESDIPVFATSNKLFQQENPIENLFHIVSKKMKQKY